MEIKELLEAKLFSLVDPFPVRASETLKICDGTFVREETILYAITIFRL
jgi:hypothetical protein